MKEIFAWAPWFRELAVKIAERDETWLVEKARQVDWSGNPELLKHGHQGIDPFSFVYSLAQKNTAKQRLVVYPSVEACFGLKPLPDLGNEYIYTFPAPPTRCCVLQRRQDLQPGLAVAPVSAGGQGRAACRPGHVSRCPRSSSSHS